MLPLASEGRRRKEAGIGKREEERRRKKEERRKKAGEFLVRLYLEAPRWEFNRDREKGGRGEGSFAGFFNGGPCRGPVHGEPEVGIICEVFSWGPMPGRRRR